MADLWKLDDPEWMKRRKLLWSATKDYHTLGQARDEAKARKEFFLAGTVKAAKMKDDVARIASFYAVQGRSLRLLPGGDEALFAKVAERVASRFHHGDRCRLLHDFIGHTFGDDECSAQQTFATPYGMMDGWERTATRILLPPRYDHERHLAEVAAEFRDGRTMYSPLEAFNLMMQVGYGFLVHFAGNPHHPIQEFVDYWLQTLPYFRFADTAPPAYRNLLWIKRQFGAERSALAFCQAVRLFQEPRDFTDANSPARQFRDRLFARFEQGTGCAEFDAVWRSTAQAPCPALVSGPGRGSEPPEKVLFGAQYGPDVLARIHAAFAALGGTDEPFDADRITCVALRDKVTYRLKELLGYARSEGDGYVFSKDGMPAFHYSFRLSPSVLLRGADTAQIDLHLLWLLPAEGFSADAERQPRVVMFQSWRNRADHSFSTIDELPLRRMLWRLRTEQGLPFSNVGCGTEKAAWPKNTINIPHGCQIYSNLDFQSHYITDFDVERKVAGDWVEDVVPLKPYKGKHPGADLAQFRREAAAPIA